MTTTNPFSDEHFTKFYVRHMLSDPTFLERVADDLDPEIFGNETLRLIVRIVLEYYKEYKSPPGELIFSELEQMEYIPKDAREKAKTHLETLFKLDAKARDRLLKGHEDFVEHNRLKNLIQKLLELGKKSDYDKAKEVIHEYVTWRPRGLMDPGSTMADIDARIQRRLEEEDDDYFWFLIRELDRYGIKFRRGSLVSWLSQASSVGKTLALCHCACALIAQGHRVVMYLTEEDEEDIQDRLDQRIASLTRGELTNRDAIEKAMRHLFRGDDAGEWLRIKSFSERVSVEGLREHNALLRNHYGFYADCAIVDYGDELMPSSPKLIGDLYGAGEDIWRDLKRWAKEEDIVVMTAMQGGRGAIEKTHADQGDVAQSLAKIFLSDLVLSINRTPAEQEEGLTRVFVAKNRLSEVSKVSVTFRTDVAKQAFYLEKREDD